MCQDDVAMCMLLALHNATSLLRHSTAGSDSEYEFSFGRSYLEQVGAEVGEQQQRAVVAHALHELDIDVAAHGVDARKGALSVCDVLERGVIHRYIGRMYGAIGQTKVMAAWAPLA